MHFSAVIKGLKQHSPNKTRACILNQHSAIWKGQA